MNVSKSLRQIVVIALCLSLVIGTFAVISEDSLAASTPKNGWYKVKGKKQKYYKNGKAVKGLQKIGKKYYYFNKKGNIQRNKSVKVRKITYYLATDGHLEGSREGKKYYYTNGVAMTSADTKDFKTYLKAKKIIKKITKPGWSKAKKRKVAFRYVMKFNYKTWRKFNYKRAAWPATYANDHFNHGLGNCHSDAAAFAYLAAAIGYKKVYVCVDSTKSGNAHGWAQVNGRVYDPLFAQAKSYSKHYNAPYRVYYASRPAGKIKIPMFSPSHAKQKQARTAKKKYIKKWDSKKKKLYWSTGATVKGIAAYKGKFYAFDAQGIYDSVLTKKLRAAAKKGKDIAQLKALVGSPKKTSYSDSCIDPPGSTDGIWTYEQFTFTTFKNGSTGKETFAGLN